MLEGGRVPLLPSSPPAFPRLHQNASLWYLRSTSVSDFALWKYDQPAEETGSTCRCLCPLLPAAPPTTGTPPVQDPSLVQPMLLSSVLQLPQPRKSWACRSCYNGLRNSPKAWGKSNKINTFWSNTALKISKHPSPAKKKKEKADNSSLEFCHRSLHQNIPMTVTIKLYNYRLTAST